MQNVKKTNNKFFRSPFSLKSSNGQVESTTDYPARKVSSEGQKIVAQSSTPMKKLIFFSFLFHQIFLWTRENEVLTPRPSFSWRKAEVFFCQLSESHTKSCKFFEKKSSKLSYGQIEWNFDTTAGNKFVKGEGFFPMSQTGLKTAFLQKILFSQKKTFLWAHWMPFWWPGRFF